MPDPALFSTHVLRDFLQARLAEAKSKSHQVPAEQLRASGSDAVAASVIDGFCVEPLAPDFARIAATLEETQIDVRRDPDFAHFGRGPALHPGTRYHLHVPFTGTPELFQMEPSSRTGTRPHGRVKASQGGGTLTMTVDVPRGRKAAPAIDKRRSEQQRLVEQYVEFQRTDVEEFNQSLSRVVLADLQARLRELESTDSALDSLGIPLATKAGAPALPVRLHQQIRPQAPPPTGRSARTPERNIKDSDYDNILSLIRHQCRTFEGAPESFSKLDEEHLRDIIRASLNAVYRQATAEAFRSHGKTDLCIEADSRAAFVAECKVWSGGKGLSDAIDQLLSYLTWRDCKAAIIVFNKDVRGFVPLLQSRVAPCLEQHSAYRRTITASPDQGEWAVQFAHPDGQEVVCQVMVFNLHHGQA